MPDLSHGYSISPGNYQKIKIRTKESKNERKKVLLNNVV
jgi:hypothetical protein